LAPAALGAQNVTFSLDLENVSLATVFKEIEKKSDYSFVFRSDEIKADEIVSLRVKDQTIEAVLGRVLKSQGLQYVINGRHITVYRSSKLDAGTSAAHSSDKTVSGTASDENGALAGVTVTVKGTNIGVLTGSDGRYSVNVPDGGATLVFSLMGFAAREVAVGGRTAIDVILTENVEEIEEIVVVGYGTQKKTHLSGAVSTISAKALENRPVGNANLALQGLAPNVNITAGNGNPLQAPGINVRGYTSINGGEALILVDNVPVSALEFSRLNPADIANISVLKDAASAAVYGARAAFGVVLVTTKTARSAKLEVSANVNYSLHRNLNVFKYDMDLVNFMEVINLVSGDDEYTAAQIDYARRRVANPALPEVRVPGSLSDPPLHWDEYDYYGMTDWWKEITDDVAPALTANISLGERSERLNYQISGEFYRQAGMFIGEDPLYRYNFRGTGGYKLTNWWSIGSTVFYSRLNNDVPNIIGGGRDRGAPASLSAQYIKNPVRNPDGTYTESGSNVVGQLLDGGRHQLDEDMIQLSFNTKIDVIKDVLSLKGDVNIRRRRETAKWWSLRIPHVRVPGSIQYRNNPNGAGNSASTVDYAVMNFYADFSKTFAGKHSVTALAGFNQEHTRDYWFSSQRENLISEQLPESSLATGPMTGGQGVRELSIRGAFGRLNYTFDDRYIVEFNGRYDGSSRYRKGKRFGYFPSGTGAWILSNERFFAAVKDALKISFLKFRGSYGALGNQLTGDNWYPYFSNMGNPYTNNEVYLDGSRPTVMLRPGSEAANNLTWERVRTVNVGVNLSLFDNRFSVDFDKYARYTEGMLAPSMPMPAQFGASVASTNAADLKTKGWELDLAWRDEIRLAGSPFSYSVRVMLSDARSWITKYHNPTRTFDAWREGQEVGEIWGYEVPGLFQSADEAAGWFDQTPIKHPRRETWEAGDMKFNNLNGDKVINSGDNTENNPGDRRIIGNSTARLPYGIDLSVGWKGFDLRAFFQGIGKRDWYPAYNEFWSSYQDSWRTPSLYIRDRWTPENPNGYYPRLFNRAAHYGGVYEWGQANTRYLQDASYLRLKNLTLGYTLPREVTGKWGISNLRVYFSGENLWTLSHIKVDALDPETVGTSGYSTYPMQAIYSLGLNLSF
jgi:TonB-linked SusC/RagA family outer membrane protein